MTAYGHDIDAAFATVARALEKGSGISSVQVLSAACAVSTAKVQRQRDYWDLFRQFAMRYLEVKDNTEGSSDWQAVEVRKFLQETEIEAITHIRRYDPHLWDVSLHVVRQDGHWLACEGRYDGLVLVTGRSGDSITAATGRGLNVNELHSRITRITEAAVAGIHSTARGRQPPIRVVFNNSRPVDQSVALGRFDRLAAGHWLNAGLSVSQNRSTAFFDPTMLPSIAKLGAVDFLSGSVLADHAKRLDAGWSWVEAFYTPDQGWSEQSSVLHSLAAVMPRAGALTDRPSRKKLRVFMSLEFEKRVWVEQEGALLAFLQSIRNERGLFSIVINGMTGLIFQEETRKLMEFYAGITERERATIRRWRERLGEEVTVEHLAGLDMTQKVARIASCDIFVVPGGTAALLALLAGVPGMYYSHPALHQHFANFLAGFRQGLPICGGVSRVAREASGVIDWTWAGVGGESYSISKEDFLSEALAGVARIGPFGLR